MVKVGEHKPVMPTLKAMKVGDTELWPIERLEVVRVTTGRLSAMTAGLVVEVTRTA